MVNATNEREFHAAFAKIVQVGAGGLLIPSSVFFISQRRQLVALAARHALPTVYSQREYAKVGGLIGYGPSQSDAGVYVGRILKGEKPGDLPVEFGCSPETRRCIISPIIRSPRMSALTSPRWSTATLA